MVRKTEAMNEDFVVPVLYEVMRYQTEEELWTDQAKAWGVWRFRVRIIFCRAYVLLFD